MRRPASGGARTTALIDDVAGPGGDGYHGALDVDDDRVAASVQEHMVGPELAVDQPVAGPRAERSTLASQCLARNAAAAAAR